MIPEHAFVGGLSSGSEITQIGPVRVFNAPNQLGRAKGKAQKLGTKRLLVQLQEARAQRLPIRG
eukprot:7927664-Pyramimonas_sp.AAC.1